MNVTITGYIPSETLTKPVAKDTETIFDFTLTWKPDWISFSGFNDPIEMGIQNKAKAGAYHSNTMALGRCAGKGG